MSSLTINQEKQIRALKRDNPLMKVEINREGILTSVSFAHYEELARHVREYRGLDRKWSEKAKERREELLKKIDLCLAVLDEK